jgi:hypothetical protein
MTLRIAVLMCVLLVAVSAFAVYMYMNRVETNDEQVLTREQKELIKEYEGKINDLEGKKMATQDSLCENKSKILDNSLAKDIGIIEDNFIEDYVEVETLYNDIYSNRHNKNAKFKDTELGKLYRERGQLKDSLNIYEENIEEYIKSLNDVKNMNKKGGKPQDEMQAYDEDGAGNKDDAGELNDKDAKDDKDAKND